MTTSLTLSLRLTLGRTAEQQRLIDCVSDGHGGLSIHAQMRDNDVLRLHLETIDGLLDAGGQRKGNDAIDAGDPDRTVGVNDWRGSGISSGNFQAGGVFGHGLKLPLQFDQAKAQCFPAPQAAINPLRDPEVAA